MTKYDVEFTSRFKKDVRRLERQGRNMSLLRRTVAFLASGAQLPASFRDHPLKGSKRGFRECHISSDWLLVYKIESDVLVLTLSRTGTHAELFGK